MDMCQIRGLIPDVIYRFWLQDMLKSDLRVQIHVVIKNKLKFIKHEQERLKHTKRFKAKLGRARAD